MTYQPNEQKLYQVLKRTFYHELIAEFASYFQELMIRRSSTQEDSRHLSQEALSPKQFFYQALSPKQFFYQGLQQLLEHLIYSRQAKQLIKLHNASNRSNYTTRLE